MIECEQQIDISSADQRGFRLVACDGAARRGEFETLHGRFETPAFMPVGTQGSVKGLNPDQVCNVGTEILLVNAYHLSLRPGEACIRDLGGIHAFIAWDGPILCDSGGFQVFSLSGLRTVSDEGVRFQSHIDGSECFLSPERVIEVQEDLGVDIMMALDECVGYGATRESARVAVERTAHWAERCKAARRTASRQLFGIVQGGFFEDLRELSAKAVTALGFDGYAIGGVSVGEPPELLHRYGGLTASLLPEDSIRYLMGVGTPSDIVRAVGYGVDLFDCVIPTRSARFGRIFTGDGFINLRNACFRADSRPLMEGCDCYACANFSRAYVAHLIHAREMLGVQLATIHNLRFYQRLMSEIREAISRKRFQVFYEVFLERRTDPEGPRDA